MNKKCGPYRLGDMVKYNGTNMWDVDEKLRDCYPDTIGGKYMRETNDKSDIKVLSEIVQNHCSSKDIQKNVIHLRLGDSLCNKGDSKSPADAASFSNTINTLIPAHESKTILYGNHNGSCIEESSDYLETVKKLIPNTEVLVNENPDDDFCRMINSAQFVVGTGGFSEMAKNVREYNGKTSIYDKRISGFNKDGINYSSDIDWQRETGGVN